MGKKCKKKVQWRQLSLNEFPAEEGEQEGEECEEEDGEGGSSSPIHDHPSSHHCRSPYGRPSHHPFPPNFPRRGAHPHGYYYRNFDRRIPNSFDRRGGGGGGGGFDRYNNENLRNLENRGPYGKPPFYERNYYYANKYCGRPPYFGERGFKFGYIERGRRPFRPYGRPGFFHRGPFLERGYAKCGGSQEEEEEEEEWEEMLTEGQLQQGGADEGDRPSQPVHTVMINNEAYTKIQTPRQEVIFKKSSLDRKQDSLDQASMSESVTSGSGSSSTGSGDQLGGDQVSLSGSMEENPSMVGDDPPDTNSRDQIFEDPSEMFVNEVGGPPLAGVVMQQAYPGGPMFTIPVHWTPFIDPGLIPGETALTPLDPAFTHVIDPKALPIDPAHILPVQHDASGSPVQVQVKVDANGVPIQIEPTAFTVSLSSLHPCQPEAKDQEDSTAQQGEAEAQRTTKQETENRENTDNKVERGEEVASTEEEVAPTEEEVAPTEEEVAPMEEEVAPMEEEVALTEEEVASTEEEVAPTEEEVAPTEEEVAPTEEEVVPMEEVGKGEGESIETTREEQKDTVQLEEETRESVDKDLPQNGVESEHRLSTSSNDVACDASPCTGVDDTVDELLAESEVQEMESVVDQVEEGETPLTEEPACEVLENDSTNENQTPLASADKSSEEVRAASMVPAEGTDDQVVRPMEEEEEEEEEEEDEEEEEEDMLTKEAEEGSDSSDSQYASMSESSSTPTTPAGEPSDAHETAAPALTTTTATDQTPAKEENNTTSSTTTPEEAQDDVSCPDDSQADSQAADAISSTEVLQGYVMVPILTPYYHPSVLYGYPVVVSQQQQLQQQPPPPPHQHCYSKRKKKKYQRRRHADAPDAGSYLDPQLYTGEPFVATPGGYVVPIEAAASVCQVHGLQYITPAFQQQLPDEGFVSVQPSPYLPEVASNPPSVEVQQSEGTSQDDASKTVFSDLQDTERQQIQEILLQERDKDDKSDSTESSDSGVSESEETAAAELSCDELESRKQHTSQAGVSACDSSQEHTIETDSSTTLPCQEEVSLSSERIVPQTSLGDTSEKNVAKSDTIQLQEVTGEFSNPQYHITDGNPSVAIKSNDNQKELLPESDKEESGSLASQETGHCDSPTEGSQSSVTSEEVGYIQKSLHKTTIAVTVADTVSCSSDQETETNSLEPEVRDEFQTTFEKNVEKEMLLDNATESIVSFDASLNKHSKSINDSAIETPTENVSEIPECAHESEIKLSERYLETKTSDLIDEVVEENCNFTNPSQNIVEIYKKIATGQLTECDIPEVHKQQIQSCSEASIFDTESSLEEVKVQGCPITSECKTNISSCQRRDFILNDGGTEENFITQRSLKDLKVTEAVKRWIREVTPEKAFTLSEELQTRLLGEQDHIRDMDTEGEYIEDVISEDSKSVIVIKSKNVKGNPFVAASSDVPNLGMEGCSKRVALMNRLQRTTPDILDEYDGASTISNLSFDHLYSEVSNSHPVSINHSFDEEEVEYTENPDIYNPSAYTKYYQLGIEIDDISMATPPLSEQKPCEVTPTLQFELDTVSECGSEEVETIPHKYDVVYQQTGTSPMSLATEILKAEKVLKNMAHILGPQKDLAYAEQCFGNPDIYLKHYAASLHGEVSDSGVQSEESSDETEARSIVSSSGVGSSLASTPAVSPAHHHIDRPPLQSHPLRNLSVGEGPVPCRTVCCAVM